MEDIVIIREKDAVPYSPPGHEGTKNIRLAGPENGCENVEFCIGITEAGGGSENHVHETFDQLMYVLEGKMKVTSGISGQTEILEPGDFVRFPAGVPHGAKSLTPAKVIVIYCPPKQHLSADGRWFD